MNARIFERNFQKYLENFSKNRPSNFKHFLFYIGVKQCGGHCWKIYIYNFIWLCTLEKYRYTTSFDYIGWTINSIYRSIMRLIRSFDIIYEICWHSLVKLLLSWFQCQHLSLQIHVLMFPYTRRGSEQLENFSTRVITDKLINLQWWL